MQQVRKSFWAHPIEFLGDVGQVEGRFGSLGDSVNLGEIGARFALNLPRASKSFWAYPMEVLGNIGQMEALSVCLGIVLISTQYWCTICAKRTIGSKISLDAPNCTPT
jgi:hypothetical protein